MNKIFTHFSSILDDMLYDSLFFNTYFQSPTSLDEDIIGSVDDCNVPENIEVRFGATRACIIDHNYDYVVKFDINSYDESACEREIDFYTKAMKQGLEKYFAKPIFIGIYRKRIHFYEYYMIEQNMEWYGYDIDFDENFMAHEDEFGNIEDITISIPLYAYPRAKRYSKMPVDGAEENNYITIAKKIVSPMRKENLSVAINFIREYGENAYRELSYFLIENHINDLHLGNIGMINNRYCFIDYGGYYSSCDLSYEE